MDVFNRNNVFPPITWRNYQVPIVKNFTKFTRRGEEHGQRIYVLCMHRRSGKDVTCFCLAVSEALQVKQLIWVVAPLQKQLAEIFWQTFVLEGKTMTQLIPPEFITRIDRHSMTIELVNGSIIRFLGADSPDALRGSQPKLVILSEFSQMKPNVLPTIFMPMMGIDPEMRMLINYTPFGKNHAYELAQQAQADPETYYHVHLPVSATGAIDKKSEKMMRDNMMSDDAAQELDCSYTSPLLQSFYGDSMTIVEERGYIVSLPVDDAFPVCTSWDLGVSDSTVIVWFQLIRHSNFIHVLACYENHSKPLSHYAAVITSKGSQFNYAPRGHYLPHDGGARDRTARTPQEHLRDHEIHTQLIPRTKDKMSDIKLVQSMLSRCKFNSDDAGVRQLIEALKTYGRAYDYKTKSFSRSIRHDWSSHFADAFACLCRAVDGPLKDRQGFVTRQTHAIGTDHDPYLKPKPQNFYPGKRKSDSLDPRDPKSVFGRPSRYDDSGADPYNYDPFDRFNR